MKPMKISAFAQWTGVTVRTLHHYDQIGLLKPTELSESGYRLYGEEALSVLQQILFFRELEFPLEDIRRIMSSPSYERSTALRQQRDLLQKKRDRLDRLIQLTEQSMEGESTMDFTAFDHSEIERCKQAYAQEAQERWGETEAYQESTKKTNAYSKADWETINRESGEIFAGFAALRGQDVAGDAAQALVKRWQAHITKYYYRCTNEILMGLGQMYMQDERFTKNIDRFGEGTAQCMSLAIEAYLQKT